MNLLAALRITVPIPPTAGKATPATSAPPTREATASPATALNPTRYLFWLVTRGVRVLRESPEGSRLPGKLSFGTESGYAWPLVRVAFVRI